jgi:inositol phosphorylceramide mannosyltransferase catalytic subunit
MTTKIPKRIIQVWGGSLDVPLFSKASAANVKLLNPEFEYLFFNDESMEAFVNQHFPEYRRVFDSFRYPIQRFDFFRYLAIYQLGGFYFDMDIFLAKPLDELLQYGCVFAFEAVSNSRLLREKYQMDWELGNYAFGAAAGHPFMLAIIKNCIRAQEDTEWLDAMMRPIPRVLREEFSVLYSSGPGLVSRTLAEYTVSRKDVKVLFPEDICDQSYWNRFGEYGVHVRQGNWRKKKNLFRRRLVGLCMSWEDGKALEASRKLGGSRSLEFKDEK